MVAGRVTAGTGGRGHRTVTDRVGGVTDSIAIPEGVKA